MNFAPDIPRRPRRPGLTPMVDVVFLLLVFFMLAARFAPEGALPLSLSGGAGSYSGPPRLVTILPDGQTLNGRIETLPGLITALGGLTETGADPIILRAGDGASLQRLVTVIEALQAAGFTALVLIE